MTTLRRLGPLLALPVFVWLLARVDGAALARSVAALGAWAWLVPLPFLAAACLDVLSWSLLLPRRERRPRILALLGVRLSLETVALCLPGGGLVADGLAPAWLRRRCRVPPADGVAVVALRKCLVVAAQALFLALASALAITTLASCGALPAVLAAAAAALLTLAALGARLLVAGRLFAMLHARLALVPGDRLRRWRARLAPRFEAIDRRLRLVAHNGHGRLLAALALLTLAFVLDAFETFLILRLLGADIAFTLAAPAEALLQLVRVAAVFVPAGLGVQDAGYALFLGAARVPDAAQFAAAFVLVKRGREALVALVGYVLMLPGRPRRQAVWRRAAAQRRQRAASSARRAEAALRSASPA